MYSKQNWTRSYVSISSIVSFCLWWKQSEDHDCQIPKAKVSLYLTHCQIHSQQVDSYSCWVVSEKPEVKELHDGVNMKSSSDLDLYEEGRIQEQNRSALCPVMWKTSDNLTNREIWGVLKWYGDWSCIYQDKWTNGNFFCTVNCISGFLLVFPIISNCVVILHT